MSRCLQLTDMYVTCRSDFLWMFIAGVKTLVSAGGNFDGHTILRGHTENPATACRRQTMRFWAFQCVGGQLRYLFSMVLDCRLLCKQQHDTTIQLHQISSEQSLRRLTLAGTPRSSPRHEPHCLPAVCHCPVGHLLCCCCPLRQHLRQPRLVLHRRRDPQQGPTPQATPSICTADSLGSLRNTGRAPPS
jgi:hypothetical protein